MIRFGLLGRGRMANHRADLLGCGTLMGAARPNIRRNLPDRADTGASPKKDLMLSPIAAEEKCVYSVRSGLRSLQFPNVHRYQIAFARCQRSPRSPLLSKLLSLIWFARLTNPRPSARLAQSLIASGFGPLSAQAFSIALVPVLFRLYEPSDFGVWAAIQAVAIIVGSLLSFRFDLALVIERDPRPRVVSSWPR
ncbi:lipopolysaccharide biosynthesis protein [Bradyrhizobium sp. RDM4]|uniref:lipopolysaccharide biosynthesis protein n=1 Tax=Bradyrhizobium sp. RDM4 TaxID=3378765 RepID=UPI0038FD0A6E